MDNPKHPPPSKDLRSQQILADFDAFKKTLELEGFFKANLVWYLYKILSILALCPIALFFHYIHWYLTSALLIGLFWQQLGWLGHEASHHQVFANRNWNNALAWFLGNVCQGFSAHWWKDRHNSHHATTNILDADPDIDNIPMLAWAESDLDKAPKWVLRTIPYQAYYFILLLPVLRLAWCINSITFVKQMKSSRYKEYVLTFFDEAVGLSLHWLGVFFLLYALPTWTWVVIYFIVSECLAGFGIAIIVFFNHYSCEKYPAHLAGNFVCLQLYTTRNMTPGFFTDWICGGLNYQIEHHLFPTIPRHRLSTLSSRVKQFCQDHELPYLSDDFSGGLWKVLAYLNSVAQIAKKRLVEERRRTVSPQAELLAATAAT